MNNTEKYAEEAKNAVSELIESAALKKGDILVVGCSTSEIIGSKIGTDSVPEVADAVCAAIKALLDEKGIYLAAQCCEHLNRAIIIESALASERGIDTVNVIPQPKAGGSLATAAYRLFKAPAAVEKIRADAGLDIGQTLIGMHLKEVAVPLRLKTKTIGDALLTAARVRPKFIGGCRAVYDENLM